MALCNDNLGGYSSPILNTYKVRWIEMAAVLPCWTCMIVYYLEGDYGHLMTEHVGKQRYRTAVRGHCYSFIMPWEDILDDLSRNCSDQDLTHLPREEECMKYLLRIHLRVAGADFHQQLKQVHLRPFVLVLLLHELIEQGHEVFRGKGSAEVLKARMRAAVEARYPEHADDKHLPYMEKKGSIPPSIPAVLEENELKRREEAKVQESDGKRRRTMPLIDDKNATPGDASASIESCLADARPKSFTMDRDTVSSSDPAALRAGALERYGDLKIQTGSKFVDQWKSKYYSQVFPFVIPRMVSGPDYDPENKWRRKLESPVVTSKEFTRGFARRVEALCRNDWTALPAIRSVDFSFTAQHTMSMVTPFTGKRDTPAALRANELVQAAKRLYHTLWHGFVGTGIARVPIAGDTTRLPHAHGLSPLERKLAWSQHYIAQHLPGTQQVRRMMGHAQFGARVVLGDCIFITVSPNPQHSALVLRLSRYRADDPCLAGEDDLQTELRRNCGRSNPSLEAQSETAEAQCETAEVNLPIPSYEFRRIASARDPLAVCDAYTAHIRLRLARVLGVRMCPRCPRCNEEGSPHPCQDKFGSNMMPMGGFMGGCPGLGGATEHQRHATLPWRGARCLYLLVRYLG